MIRREEPIPALSAGLSYVLMTGLLLVAANPRLDPARPRAPAPELPVSSETARAAPAVTAAPTQHAPEPQASLAQAPEVAEEWPQDEILRGREQCMHILSATAAEVEWLAPIRKGPCGLPAPVRLKSVGSGERKVVFEPAVDVNCRMVAALGTWVKETLQPASRERFKSDVVRIVGASGYSCRNIYNRPNARLSQHALANAIDIGGFGLENGRTVRVLKGWGLTGRDIAARKLKAAAEAKAKAKAASSAKVADASGDGAQQSQGKAAQSGKTLKSATQGSGVTRASLSPAIEIKINGKPAAASSPEATAAAASEAAKPAETAKPTDEALFLRAIHGGACGTFGTVLGPEANDPHRNHFHLDLISRRGRGYCE